MTLKVKNIIYGLYSTLIYLVYMQTVSIIPPALSWIGNKLWYLIAPITLCIVLYESKAKVDKVSFSPIVLLLFYVIFSFISYSITLDINEAVIYSLTTITYLFTFFIFIKVVKIFPLYDLIKPFITSSLAIILLSTLMYIGVDIPIYHSDGFSQGVEVDYANTLAFSGVFINQNTFGGALTVAAVSFYTGILLMKDKRFLRYILYISIFTSLIFAILTLSRATILTILIIFTLFTIRNITNKTGFYILIAALISLISLYSYLYIYIEKFLDRVETGGSSARTDIWGDALNAFYSHPFTGVGEYYFTTAAGNKLVAHNAYLSQLVNLGIFASLFWFVWLIYCLKYSSTYLLSLNKKPKINILLTAYIFGVLIYNAVESAIISPVFPMTLLLMLAFSYNIHTNRLDKKSQSLRVY